jgi:PAB1-binding protein PBP1
VSSDDHSAALSADQSGKGLDAMKAVKWVGSMAVPSVGPSAAPSVVPWVVDLAGW